MYSAELKRTPSAIFLSQASSYKGSAFLSQLPASQRSKAWMLDLFLRDFQGQDVLEVLSGNQEASGKKDETSSCTGA